MDERVDETLLGHVPSDRPGAKMKRAFEGELLEPAAHQIGDSGTVGAEECGGLRLVQAFALDEHVSFVRQLDFGKCGVGVGVAQGLKNIDAADLHTLVTVRPCLFPDSIHVRAPGRDHRLGHVRVDLC